VQAFHCFLMVVPTTAKMDTLNRPTKSNFAKHLNLHLYCKSVIFVIEVLHVWIPLHPKTHPERVFYNPQFLAIKYCDIFNSNTTSGYEIAGNFRSQIRVFVSATIFTSERSEQVKIVLRNKYEWSEEKISGNFVPTSLYEYSA
jgi:hypothetical protein